jgi:hypothetical protein
MIIEIIKKIQNKFMSKKLKWIIRHPGDNHIIECDAFEECMEKWFEGHNLPYLVINGKAENSNIAYQRVKNYLPSKFHIAK